MLRLAGMNGPLHRNAHARDRMLLAAILLLALSLRVHRLDGQSVWYDEAVTAQVAGQGLAELTRWTAGDIQPPLYYYLVAGWTRAIAAGVSGAAPGGEWALRFPSACFGLLGVALMWAVARRLFRPLRLGSVVAPVAALLMAVSPLHVYYSQEARMYTLLTALALLTGYALLRAMQGLETDKRIDSGARRVHSSIRFDLLHRHAPWLWFVLSGAALLYTHYFGAFLLLALFVCWLLCVLSDARGMEASAGQDVSENPQRDRLKPRLRGFTASSPRLLTGLLSFAAIALIYVPWLPSMLGRYREDRSYWQGTLKLGEALRHVALSFTTGAPETMLEGDGLRLLPWFGLALLLAVAALAWQERAARRAGARGISPTLVLLLVLLLPVAAVLLLASASPKFNPRYLMLVSPAYLLLLAAGIAALARGRLTPRRQDARPDPASASFAPLREAKPVAGEQALAVAALVMTVFAVGLLVALVAVSVSGLRNWYTDPAFTKAQWRELVAYVRAEAAPGDAVLLVSGHAYPAWHYYAPDVEPVRLPEMDILDVQAILGFDAGPQLAEALAGKSAAWLVTWQDEVVDPAGFVPYYLDRAGAEQPAGREFWHLGLRHWQLRPDATYPAEPQPQHTDAANFDHKLALLGWDEPEQTAAGRAAEGRAAERLAADRQTITLYWRVLNTLTADYQLSLVTEDAAGRELARWDGRPAGYDYPTTRWQPGQTLFGRVPLPLPADALDEVYVTIAVYGPADPSGLDIRDIADNPAGKRVRLGPVKVGDF